MILLNLAPLSCTEASVVMVVALVAVGLTEAVLNIFVVVVIIGYIRDRCDDFCYFSPSKSCTVIL